MWNRSTVVNDGVSLAVFEAAGTTNDSHPDQASPVVLLVHGWPDSHHLWTHVAPTLRDAGMRVFAYDCRGFGDSDHPADDSGFRLSVLADDMFAVAEAISPDAPVHVVAHDWGSVQAWEAVTRPGARRRIASFVSVSGPNLDHLSEWMRSKLRRPTPSNLKQLGAQALSSAYTAFFQTPVLPKAFFGVFGTPRIWAEFLHRIEGTPRENVVVGESLRSDMISGLALYRANIRPKLASPSTRPTDVPVLEIINERDIALRAAIFDDTHTYASSLWRRASPTGHWLPYTHPTHLAETALAFIAEQTGTGDHAAGGMARARVFGRPQPLSGKLAVITGAGRGIGRETAFALAAQGCELVLADLDPELLAETSREAAQTTLVSSYTLDVADVEAFTSFAKTVSVEHGVPDIVINNAGVGLGGNAVDATAEQVDRVIDVNLRSVITGSRLFARQMIDRGIGGQIVNVASAAAFTPQRSLGIYSATKAGVLMFSESLRGELAEHRIGVSAICPGIVDTGIVTRSPMPGVDAGTEKQMQDQMQSFYAKRGFGPALVARDIVAAIIDDKAVVPVTPEAKIGYRIYRFTPWLSRWAAKQKVTR